MGKGIERLVMGVGFAISIGSCYDLAYGLETGMPEARAEYVEGIQPTYIDHQMSQMIQGEVVPLLSLYLTRTIFLGLGLLSREFRLIEEDQIMYQES